MKSYDGYQTLEICENCADVVSYEWTGNSVGKPGWTQLTNKNENLSCQSHDTFIVDGAEYVLGINGVGTGVVCDGVWVN